MMSSNGGFNSKGGSHDADEKKQGNDFCGKLRLLNFQEFQECNLACFIGQLKFDPQYCAYFHSDKLDPLVLIDFIGQEV